MNDNTDIQFGDTDRRVGDKWPTHRHKGRKRRQIYKDKIIRSPFKSHALSSAPSSGSSRSCTQITSLAQQRFHHICVKCDRLHMIHLDLI